MAEKREGKEKEVTFNQGTPQEHTAKLHETPGHDYVGAHKQSHGAYGVAAVTEKLKGMDFPASKQDVMNRLEGEDIHWSKGQDVDLGRISGRMPERFNSPVDVVKAISDNVDESKREHQ